MRWWCVFHVGNILAVARWSIFDYRMCLASTLTSVTISVVTFGTFLVRCVILATLETIILTNRYLSAILHTFRKEGLYFSSTPDGRGIKFLNLTPDHDAFDHLGSGKGSVYSIV